MLGLSLMSHPAVAMENGQDAPIGGRVVPIIEAEIGLVCTGFLYTERIVLTAGHCLINERMNQPFLQVSVGAPGETYSSTSRRFKVNRAFSAPNWAPADENNFNPSGEFGIYVLDQSIPVSGKVTIATKDQIQNYLTSGARISNIGYGKQNVSDKSSGLPSRTPKYGEFPLVSPDAVNQRLEEVWRFIGNRKNYNMQIHVLQVPSGPSTCSGDSGGPFYVMNGTDYVYLGPISNGIGGIPNCSGKPWSGPDMYLGSVAAYDYLELIAQAERYVTNVFGSAQVSKITIKCKKQKKIISRSGVKPDCPRGYKKLNN